MSKAATAFLGSMGGQYAVLATVGIVGFIIIHNILKKDIKQTAGAIGDGISDVAESAGGVISGHNTIVESARTDAYAGAGVLGTVGAATDIASGGLFSQVGEWLGGKLADAQDYFDGDPNPSASIQSSTGNPFAYGTSKQYQGALNVSPVQAQFAASPWAISPDYYP